jgi:ADP-ribosylglycohydrolase
MDLREKFYGCICGAHIGSAMGAPVEGWDYARIQQQYGTVTELLPYEHYGNGWQRPPGATEDGIERQKLMITAIMAKGDRITAEDVKQVWLGHIKPESVGMVSEPFEATLLAMARADLPGRDIGRYCDYAGLNSMARACHPLGLINAGDVESAMADVMEVGLLYQTGNSRGLKWACVSAVAIAAATTPGATVDTVLGAILDHCDEQVVGEMDRELQASQGCTDFRALRTYFDGVYSGKGTPYWAASANEVVTKAVCVFRMVHGNTFEAMVAAVNMGRDTDCLAAVAAGISGALTGAASIPAELVAQTDAATARNVYTNSQRTLRETADGLHSAYQQRLGRLQAYLATMSAGEES